MELDANSEKSESIQKLKFVFISGNLQPVIPKWFGKLGCDLEEFFKNDLQKNNLKYKYSIEARSMPCLIASSDKWVPELNKMCDEDAIVVCHSSGAIAAMRYAETNKLKGLVLIGAYESDLNENKLPPPIKQVEGFLERKSGFFNKPWDFRKIRENVSYIIQIHSHDDEIIPDIEAKNIKEKLNVDEYIEVGHFNRRGHNSMTGKNRDYMPEVELALANAIIQGKFDTNQ